MSVLLIVGPNGESRWVCERDRQTDGQTPDSYITFSLDAASVTTLLNI